MEQGKFYKQAKEFAKEHNFDNVMYAGIENGCEYYKLCRVIKGHYLGQPNAIKITSKGLINSVWDAAELSRMLMRIQEIYKFA